MKMTKRVIKELIQQAEEQAYMSPDPWKKVGCVGISKDGYYFSVGHNHAGSVKNSAFWLNRESRRPFIIHAEIEMLSRCMKAIHTVVITLFPCVACMNALAAFGIKRIYYGEIYDKDRQALEVAKFHGITCIQYKQ